MPVVTEAKPVIQAAALDLLQTRGYQGFTLRTIAEMIGCPISVVHQCYASKVGLATEVTQNYTDAFMALLKGYQEENPEKMYLINMYVKRFRTALVDQDRLCLCGMLGAEVEGLPKPLRTETKRFFELNQQWLTSVFKDDETSHETAENRANVFLAGMEGAMILARALDKMTVFDSTTRLLVASLT